VNQLTYDAKDMSSRKARSRVLVIARENGNVVCERCVVADRMWSRTRGLLGRSELPRGEGLLIRPTWSVHTAFMRFPIDVLFLASDQTVKRVVHALAPWRAASCWGAKCVVELAAGEADARGLRVGDRLVWESGVGNLA
jgi:uncharacterized membrane protein (UPF0127 family)